MTNVADQINEDMKTAMKAGDKPRLNVLRNLRAALKNAAIEKAGADAVLDDPEVMAVLRKQIKQRQDSASSFRDGGRVDLHAARVDHRVGTAEHLERAVGEPPEVVGHEPAVTGEARSVLR
jgi:uncharacterized protein YqeY